MHLLVILSAPGSSQSAIPFSSPDLRFCSALQIFSSFLKKSEHLQEMAENSQLALVLALVVIDLLYFVNFLPHLSPSAGRVPYTIVNNA